MFKVASSTGVDGDVFKARNWTVEPLVSPLQLLRCTGLQVITVCSSQKAINRKEEQTLITCERMGVVLVIYDPSRPIFTGLPLTLVSSS